jgi:ABC-type bacteriocin/lantibiotic exporter with double-glycine peptidase domain
VTLGIVYGGASSVIAGTLSVAFMAYQSQFVGRISDLIDTMVDLNMLRLHGERLADIASTEPEPGAVHAVARAGHRPVGIEVRGLAFAIVPTIRWCSTASPSASSPAIPSPSWVPRVAARPRF